MVSLNLFSSYIFQMVSCVMSVYLQRIISTATFSRMCINTISQVGQGSQTGKSS